MTYTETIESLRCCFGFGTCSECKVKSMIEEDPLPCKLDCKDRLGLYAADLIERLTAENVDKRARLKRFARKSSGRTWLLPSPRESRRRQKLRGTRCWNTRKRCRNAKCARTTLFAICESQWKMIASTAKEPRIVRARNAREITAGNGAACQKRRRTVTHELRYFVQGQS